MQTTPPVHLVTIYRPPQSKKNGNNFRTFMEEITAYFELLVISTGILLVLGDFNLHIDKPADKEGAEFISLVESLGMTQHVTGATHRGGHTLDLVLTRNQDNIVPRVAVEDKCLSDPYPVFCVLPLHCLMPKTQEKATPTLPPDKDSKDLVHEFSTFFIDKITRIRASIVSEGKSKSFSLTVQKPPSCALDMWEPATEDELKRIIMSSPSKSCGLDPLPTNLLKQCVTPLLPVISTIVNNSLITGDVPSAFKLAHVTPLIKNPSLDPTVLSNYRPVSTFHLFQRF
ncbi:hypothetical protein BSL78_18046 [Apostichopus japonicus]|uniref:Endonuclease/exonuclease/phosphatase domain-containing protein n=1 Tax=Stichopus japonicus TaxID=307972 RepID=A0A2G8KAU3_STIJA|nr:hypothetical protein BSL78_18046 [Apostichopus japonicus]